ncbi:MAG: hypothetical protein EBS53_10660, partial [Bacteroidetes bacterium]|nr:hypothetical protein [Bacteroidota bacterium]
MSKNRASDGSTIVALASPQGIGAVALIRLSGPSSARIVSAMSRMLVDAQLVHHPLQAGAQLV